MKRRILFLCAGVALCIGAGLLSWTHFQVSTETLPIVSEVLYRKAGEQNYHTGGTTLMPGEVGEVTIALRAKNSVLHILWSLKKFLPSTLSYLEGSMKINGKPVKETEIELALSKDTPVQMSFQVVATEKSTLPNTIPLTTIKEEKVVEKQQQERPMITNCPESNLALVKDTPVALSGTHLLSVEEVHIGSIAFPPNKKTDTLLLLNLETSRISPSTYAIALSLSGGKKVATNCTLTITKPTTPVFEALTPKESKKGIKQKLIVQGGNLNQIMKVSARKNGKSFPVRIQEKQNTVLILEIGTEYETGDYTLFIEEPLALATPLHFTLLP